MFTDYLLTMKWALLLPPLKNVVTPVFTIDEGSETALIDESGSDSGFQWIPVGSN